MNLLIESKTKKGKADNEDEPGLQFYTWIIHAKTSNLKPKLPR